MNSNHHNWQSNKDKVYVATATTTANHLNIEAIEKVTSMVAINNNDKDNNCNNKNNNNNANNNNNNYPS